MRLRQFVLACLIGLLGAVSLAACASRGEASQAPAPASASIDLARFMGRWHVIARVPYFAERGHVASRDEYTLRPDGRIGVHYVYRTGFGEPEKSLDAVATVKPGSGNREWTTRFFRVVPTRYRILEVAPDYSWALIDYPGRDLAWIFSRRPMMDEALYLDLRTRLRGHGVDIDKVWRVPQLPAQVGQRGFDAPKDP